MYARQCMLGLFNIEIELRRVRRLTNHLRARLMAGEEITVEDMRYSQEVHSELKSLADKIAPPVEEVSTGMSDAELADMIELIVDSETVSAGQIQKILHIGYGATCRILDRLESLRLIGKIDGTNLWRVYYTRRFDEEQNTT